MTPCSGNTTPQVISRSVHHLAEALSHIEQGIERRFLKPPLGETAPGLESFGTAWESVEGHGMMSSDMSAGEEDSKKEQKMKKTKKKEEDRLSEGRKAAPHAGRGVM